MKKHPKYAQNYCFWGYDSFRGTLKWYKSYVNETWQDYVTL